MTNIGSVDRILRLSLGAIAFILGVKPEILGIAHGILPIVLMIIGIIMIITALFKFCPLYPVLGINTNKSKK